MHPSIPKTAADLNQNALCYCNPNAANVWGDHIHITDNAIIPLKERVVDRFYDPVTRLLRMLRS